jgi:hypothetical protein
VCIIFACHELLLAENSILKKSLLLFYFILGITILNICAQVLSNVTLGIQTVVCLKLSNHEKYFMQSFLGKFMMCLHTKVSLAYLKWFTDCRCQNENYI